MKKIFLLCIAGTISFISGRDLKDAMTFPISQENEKVSLKINIHKNPSIPLENIPFWSSRSFGPSLWGGHLADITGDGYPEVITVYEQNYIYLYLNDRGVIDSTPYWQSGDWDYYIQADFGDYDNDGDLDMAVASYTFWGGGPTRLYRNENGNLTTLPVWVPENSGSATWCGWGDVDNDGDLDLAVVGLSALPAVFYNNGDSLETTPSWTSYEYNSNFGGSWADIDRDGDLDLLVGGLNVAVPTLRIYYNTNGTLETFASWTSQVNANTYIGIGIFPVDVDKDGWLDVAVSTGFIESQRNIIFKNNNGTLEGTPSWISSDANLSGFGTWGDLNNDGFLDWAVNNGNMGVVYESIAGTLNSSYAWSSNEPGGLGVNLGDIDRDGIVIKEDTLTGDGVRKLFYVSILPIERILEITIDGVPVPVTDYTYHLKSGWVSFKYTPASGSEIIIRYEHSIDLEFLLSDYYSTQKAHLYRNNTVNIEERQLPRTSLKALLNVYPSVSKGELNISYFLPLQTRIEAWIYTGSGRKLSKFLDGFQESGLHKTEKTISLKTGKYILMFRIGKENISKKILIIR